MACPLGNPNLGIILENDHQVGICPCYLCSCGRHNCSPTRLNYHKLKTNYREDFGFYKTTRNSTPVKEGVIIRSRVPVQRRSLYQADYCDWKVSGVARQKKWHPPLREAEIPFNSDSTYRQAFKNFTSPVLKQELPNPARETRLFLGPGIPVKKNSTYKASMISPRGMPVQKVRRPHDFRPLTVSPNHYRSTSSQVYQHPDLVSIDPRRLRFY